MEEKESENKKEYQKLHDRYTEVTIQILILNNLNQITDLYQYLKSQSKKKLKNIQFVQIRHCNI